MTKLTGIVIGMLLLAPRLAVADPWSDYHNRQRACEAYQAMMTRCSAPGATDNMECEQEQLTELQRQCSMAGGPSTDDQGPYRGN